MFNHLKLYFHCRSRAGNKEALEVFYLTVLVTIFATITSAQAYHQNYEALPLEQPALNETIPASFSGAGKGELHPFPSSSLTSKARSGDFAQEPVDLIIPPYAGYFLDKSKKASSQQEVSYVIDRKRFIEAYPTRCMTSTYFETPYAYEPTFTFIKPSGEITLKATSSPDEILAAGFEPNKRTIILIHGFSQGYPKTVWLRKTRALFETNAHVGRQNLIIMDFSKASSLSYAKLAAMASGLGSFVANFIMKLLKAGSDPMSVHIVAHSLGAHVAGFAGKKLSPRIGRITALDPAGPCFGKVMSNDDNDRLSRDDAVEVDVYHYDDSFLGLPGTIGQFDVYVNGGNSQPGCSDNANTMFQAVITTVSGRNRALSQSHTRSTEVATVRLTTLNCQQVAFECRNYEAFTLGECGKCDEFNNQCYLMGFDYQYAELGQLPIRSSREQKRLFISTGSDEPFCLQHYQVLIKFEPSPELSQQAKKQKWQIQTELFDPEGRLIDSISVDNQMGPNVFSHLLLTEHPVTKIRSARLQVRSHNGKLVQLQQGNLSNSYQLPFKVTNVEINFMSNINPAARKSLSSRLCPSAKFIRKTIYSKKEEQNSVEAPENWLYLEECPFEQQQLSVPLGK